MSYLNNRNVRNYKYCHARLPFRYHNLLFFTERAGEIAGVEEGQNWDLQ
jgi:hypothetical protein